jgi:protein-S-isoprenylcysteine O-methyltransferase Ste14
LVLRNLALALYFSPNQLPVAPQWSIIVLFVLLFVAGLATLYYMLRKVATATRVQAAAQRLQ